MRFEFYLARRYLFRGKAKHISFIGVISCIGVILGVATVIVAISIVNGVDGGLMERVMRFKYHLVVESFQEEDLYRAAKVIDSWQEVESAAVCVHTQVFAKFNETIVPLVVKGMDFDNAKEKEFLYQYVIKEKEDNGFLIGEGLARRYFINDEMEFYPLQKKLALQKEKIRGVYKVGLYDIDNYSVISDIERVKKLSPHYHLYLGLRIDQPFKADQVRERILADFPEGLFVSTWMESNQALFATLKLERIAMYIILTLIVIVASFNIFATLTVKVVEKTKEIGILKAVGFTSRKILSVFTLQGLIIGAIGAVGGSALGLAICFLLQKYPFIKLPEEIFFTEYLPVTVNYFDVFMIGAISLFISLVSSWLPARRASRLPPCEALRYE